MRSIKKRLLSLLLTLITILSLLPTSALAASGTGKGITITKDQAYWSTRLLANGTPYSYRPPMAAGRLLYCLDSGLGYHNATQSFFDSYTYTSATNADADTVLKTAIANSGLGEMDAATLANVKWLMTYINDSKASNVGQLFMAVQTYVWDHQSYKGEPGGDGDAGGYANADTYEMYLSLIDWMLAQKAQEDAAFQRQIEEYAAQGRVAVIVEDDSAKWAVFALSSNRKNQSFFNYYGPRKLRVSEAPIQDEPAPPAGDADITLRKVAAGTTRGLDGAKFNIYRDGQIVGSDVTKNGGIIEVKDVTKGLWSFVETEAPAGYCADSTPISVYVDTTDGDKQYMEELGKQFDKLLGEAANADDAETYVERFQSLSEGMEDLKRRKAGILQIRQEQDAVSRRLQASAAALDAVSAQIAEWDEKTVYQLLEKATVMEGFKIRVTFRNGQEIEQSIDQPKRRKRI